MTASGKRKLRGSDDFSPRKRRGWLLPNKNYMGPFNPLRNGPIRDEGDAIAFIHDVDGTEALAAGRPFYTKFNPADEDFLQRLHHIRRDSSDEAARIFYATKQQLAAHDSAPVTRSGYANVFLQDRLGISPEDFDKHISPPRSAQKRLQRARRHLAISNRPHNRSSPRQLFNDSGQPVASVKSMSVANTGGGEGNGTRQNGGLKETPIDDVWNVTRGPPDYTFATLPFIYDRRIDANMSQRSFAFRMTSPYDVLHSGTVLDANAGAGNQSVMTIGADDALGQQVNQARWYQWYATQYNYYHTVACRWHMTVENLGNQPIWMHYMYYNEDEPPYTADNDDILLWRDAKSHYIGTHGVSLYTTGVLERNEVRNNTNNSTNLGAVIPTLPNFEQQNNFTSRARGPVVEVGETYHTGDYRREIRLDENVENWTAINRNPKLPEKLLIRFQIQNNYMPPSAGNGDTQDYLHSLRVFVRLEYLVEFKELKPELRYPVHRQPIAAVINTAGAQDPDTTEGN